ncbi:MAG: cellulase family glycosylhydrolase [Kiritimatiellae bacterium]|nr:cellulase family glycosylhydrolase [Kiritimatiellia bacterium]
MSPSAAVLLGATGLLGVNYYPPFSADYRTLKENGYDHKEVIATDVAHFKRIGVDYVRLHCFDREISTPDGALRDNEHLDLLDFLLATCASNGIRAVLTPIAWFGAKEIWNTDGFSDYYDIRELITNTNTWPVQARFFKEFVAHRNRYTGFTYAKDPSVIAFEIINEPLYPDGTADETVAKYIDAMVGALRQGGVCKLIYYNSWHGRNGAVNGSLANGATASLYPTGLLSGHELQGSMLGSVRQSTLTYSQSVPVAPGKKRMIYEFEAADTPGSYMYPAMAKLFRAECVGAAALFQYDPLPIADRNLTWATHYFNLVYTPEKAISFAIAAEVMRRIPEGVAYEPASDKIYFAPFKVDANANVSQMVTSSDFLYSADALDSHPSADSLTRIWGCGRSSVVSSSGNGAYFFDKAGAGVWRVQAYPSFFELADPYTGNSERKRVTLPDKLEFNLAIPDLGKEYGVVPLEGGTCVSATDGVCEVVPGDYVFYRSGIDVSDARRRAKALDVPRFIIPSPTAVSPMIRVRNFPEQWGGDTPIPLEVQSVYANESGIRFERSGSAVQSFTLVDGTNNVVAALPSSGVWAGTAYAKDGETETVVGCGDVRFCVQPDEWNFFAAWRPLPRIADNGHYRWFAKGNDGGEPTWLIWVLSLSEPGHVSVAVQMACDGSLYSRLFPASGPGTSLVVRARAQGVSSTTFNLLIWQSDSRPWSAMVPVSDNWQDIVVPLSSMQYEAGWDGAPAYCGERPDIRLVKNIRIMLAGEYDLAASTKTHALEIKSITVR